MSTLLLDAPVAEPGARASALRRRLLTFSGVGLGLLGVAATLPLLLLIALTIDLVRRGTRFNTTRLVLFLGCFLLIEVFGLLRLALIGLTTRAGSPQRHARVYGFERAYSRALLAVVSRLFSLRFVVQGAEVVEPGPLLVFLRHASLVDVLVSPAFIANEHGLALRYVIKRELLVMPCFDVVGHWTPNRFVDRSGHHTADELAALKALKAGLPPNGGVAMYPEGTRFTPQKRERAIARLQGVARDRAVELRHLLPVHPGGVLALLEAEPRCDVLFVGHHGLEGLARVKDILRGGLVGRTVTVRFWREKAETVPQEAEARLEWVHRMWVRVDQWLDGTPSPRPSPPRGEGVS